MLAMNIITRAVVLHEGRLLTTVMNDGVRAPFHSLLGGHQRPGESMLDCLARVVKEEAGIAVAPVRLLYVVENFFSRGGHKLHETGFYFLCSIAQQVDGDLPSLLRPNLRKMISPELLGAPELSTANFQPSTLRELLVEDLKSGFDGRPRLVVINELPADSLSEPGVYTL